MRSACTEPFPGAGAGRGRGRRALRPKRRPRRRVAQRIRTQPDQLSPAQLAEPRKSQGRATLQGNQPPPHASAHVLSGNPRMACGAPLSIATSSSEHKRC